ncbi:MAG: hypothetical protein OXF05_05630, partial [Hyphomicrobiales bacterium]|nr:hypothetical protein [Hyphomicrobiales bacterium]
LPFESGVWCTGRQQTDLESVQTNPKGRSPGIIQRILSGLFPGIGIWGKRLKRCSQSQASNFLHS